MEQRNVVYNFEVDNSSQMLRQNFLPTFQQKKAQAQTDWMGSVC